MVKVRTLTVTAPAEEVTTIYSYTKFATSNKKIVETPAEEVIKIYSYMIFATIN